MRVQHLILCSLIGSLLITFGCAKRIPIHYDQIQPNALVKIQTFSGQTCNGVVQQKKIDYLLLKESRHENHLTKINRKEIATISGSEFVYDGRGDIISEWEIQQNQGNKNFLLYTVGGAGLCFGASFFIGSLLHRNLDDHEKGNKVMWATTAIGTAAGSYLFAKSGKKRDRILAIEELREQRFKFVKEQIETQKQKNKSIQQELEKERAERIKQEEELKRLKEKIKKNKKK
ncbi:MAG: hypothetical protein JSW07_20690 [bacterium]|nr:MAG: hypothetical protein JSW07_20690 [bacterium]